MRYWLIIGIVFFTLIWAYPVKEITVNNFSNSDIVYKTTLKNLLAVSKAYLFAQRLKPSPTQAIELTELSIDSIKQAGVDQVVRLSHSSVLLYLDGEFILTDPALSQRASPLQWAGPKRFHPLPISIAALPNISSVVISHDHYDHLDKASVLKLNAKVERFIVPLKVGKHLRRWGIAANKIIELDWWQQTQHGSITYTATPAQHFSGRGLFDKDHSLWAGWAIKGQQNNVFFSGDSGYFSGFKEIGERLGPFDLSLIETGAYNDLWSDIHMLPEQSVQAHLDVRGKAMLPIHNGSFDLALHDWDEPMERVWQAAKLKQVQLLTPRFGEALSLNKPGSSQPWWRDEIVPQLKPTLANN